VYRIEPRPVLQGPYVGPIDIVVNGLAQPGLDFTAGDEPFRQRGTRVVSAFGAGNETPAFAAGPHWTVLVRLPAQLVIAAIALELLEIACRTE